MASTSAAEIMALADIARHSVDLTRHTASTGLKVAGCLADLATATTAAVGTANALAGLGLKLFDLGPNKGTHLEPGFFSQVKSRAMQYRKR